MSWKHPHVTRAAFLAALAAVLLVLGASLSPALAQEEEKAPREEGERKPAISFAQDMDRRMMEQAARVGERLSERALSFFERTPLGFDLGTIDRLRDWTLTLPLKVPVLVEHVMEQSRLLGFVGSLLMLAFLLAVFYSLFGQRRVLDYLERATAPLRARIPEASYPYFLSGLKVLVASLMPLVLFGLHSLIGAFIRYDAPWFVITGSLLMLWALGALLINLLRESLTRGLFSIAPRYGTPVFKICRVVVLYILFTMAIFQGAEAFRIPQEFLALLRFAISLSIVCVLLLLLLKKKSLLGLLPDLPYASYRAVVRGLERFYFPAILLTFITGLLWCVGYKTLCRALWMKTWAVAGAFVAIVLAYHILQGWLRRWIGRKGVGDETAKVLYRALHTILLYATGTTVVLVTLHLLGLLQPLRAVLSFPVLHVGDSPLSLWTFLKATLILLGFIFVSRLLRAWLDHQVYPSIGVDEGLGYAINTFMNYFLVGAGLLFSLRSVGLDLRVLMVFAGAIGIGIGLGLQSTAANLISGFSLVFGRKIRKGDLVHVDDTLGHVREVSLRVTKVRTFDNVEYLIPNADLTSRTVINYTLSDPLVRVHVPVGVSYGADPREVERILLEVAAQDPDVVQSKAPEVWFTEYGDSSINFELLAWTDVRRVGLARMKSNLYFAIFRALADAGVEIPFPQRDLHIRSGLPSPDGNGQT